MLFSNIVVYCKAVRSAILATAWLLVVFAADLRDRPIVPNVSLHDVSLHHVIYLGGEWTKYLLDIMPPTICPQRV